MSTADRRAAAIARTVETIRGIERTMGVTRPALESIRSELFALADDKSVFPPNDFPLDVPGTSKLYKLREDADQRLALYMSVGRTGKQQPPHNHTTWAVIVGLKGKEHNQLYDRLDDGRTPGVGKIALRETVVVEHGTGVCLMPEDVHAIRLEGDPPTM
ncbi:MAG: cysteine dioxygenase, partial [Pseudomonadota bacterium]